MALSLERDFSGPWDSAAWTVRDPESGESKRLEGKAAALLSMLIARHDYAIRDDFHPFDAFTEESLDRGRVPASPRFDRPAQWQ